MHLQHQIVQRYREVKHLGPQFTMHHLRRRSGQQVQVKAKDLGLVTLRPGTSDADVFVQVFAERPYDLARFGQFETIVARHDEIIGRGHRPLILDLGANNGASAMWFARSFPRAKVVAVEPEPGNLDVCRANTARYDVEVVAAAIGSEPGNVDLVTEGRESWGVATTRNADGEVAMVTVDEVLRQQGPDVELFIVKIDIEGFEADLFSANTEWVGDATVIILEPHDWMLPGHESSRNFQRVIGAHRFEVVISGENLIYVHSPEPSELRTG